ncbi:MAG: membrane protein insertion efficiency factor YidD [Verrucomicrobiota bacterium]
MTGVFLHSTFCLLPSRALLLLIRIYRWTVSPALATLFGPYSRCRFTPSCSDYAAQAIRIHGALHGSDLAARRLCRCHPWGGCGYDPVPPEGGISNLKFEISNSREAACEHRS